MKKSVSHKPAQIPILLISIIQSLPVSGIAPDLLLNWTTITFTSLSDCNFQATILAWAGNYLLMDLSWSLPAMYGFPGQLVSFRDDFDKKKFIRLVRLKSSFRPETRCVTELPVCLNLTHLFSFSSQTLSHGKWDIMYGSTQVLLFLPICWLF